MKFRPKIDGHDYTTKMKHVERFLGEGNKVKLTIMFRGREMAHPELGMQILERVAEDVGELAIVESAPPGRTQHDDGAAPDRARTGQGEAKVAEARGATATASRRQTAAAEPTVARSRDPRHPTTEHA